MACSAILGKMLLGSATRIALRLLNLLGDLVMMLVGFIAGIPVFVELGFVLLAALAYRQRAWTISHKAWHSLD
ncbi:hypothetical protein [Campylobacter troglodytis]|uniref:GntT/GntP/DsdX family permease n=1 Tax=Campylobacter troglodytis TaxID=654363 RepID=UPI00249E0344|nr:hypothetical protein [Campylobacter troglodytis]